jgi:uncharacterized membrane protein YesL
MTKPYAGTTKALEVLNVVGDVLLLQLCFTVASIGIVTIVPAAAAFQRGLHEVLFESKSPSIRSFAARLVVVLRRYWLVALLVPVIAIMLIVAVLFWASVQSPVSLAALVVLIPLAGMSTGFYLCGLASVAAEPDCRTAKRVIALAWQRMRRQPLHVAGCIVVMMTWIFLLLNVPTLVLVGSGTVPALLAAWLLRGASRAAVAERKASAEFRSPNPH